MRLCLELVALAPLIFLAELFVFGHSYELQVLDLGGTKLDKARLDEIKDKIDYSFFLKLFSN